MKQLTIALIAMITLMSCAIKPQTVQRRKGVMTLTGEGIVKFTPLEGYQDFTPKSDTIYQYKAH